MNDIHPLANNHISVDCVVIGFDGEQLKVLLIDRTYEEDSKIIKDMKLPGDLIFKDEDLDDAAKRVLLNLTGINDLNLSQFKTFGSRNRTSNVNDVHWLENESKAKVDRIVTIAYFTCVKLDSSLMRKTDKFKAHWVAIVDIPHLAFDHNIIIKEGLAAMRRKIETSPDILFKLLPKKFTASEFRYLYQVLYDKKMDVRNFHKKMVMMAYVVKLKEKEEGVAHRAAHYYKFNKKIYNQLRL